MTDPDIKKRAEQLRTYLKEQGYDLDDILKNAPEVFRKDTFPEPSTALVTEEEVLSVFGGEEDIPKGIYCYDGNTRCPFYSYKTYDSVKVPYCLYLNEGDISNLDEEEDKKLLEYFKCDEDELEKKFPLSLLWDQVKECGINNDLEEDEFGE